MTLSQFSVFVLTLVAFATLVVIVKKHRNLEKDVVVYSLGNKEYYRDDDEEQSLHGLLHTSQVIKQVKDDDDLLVVAVPFPKNGRDFKIMLVRVLNFNSAYSNAELVRNEKEDDNFWVIISDGQIGTNSVTVELNSYMDIDVDVEFYGFKENATHEL